MNEYENEPVRGLPEELPAGETMVWQGEPTWTAIARRVFHVHALAVYFAVLIALHVTYQLTQGETLAAVLPGVAWQLSLGLAALAILSVMALAYARTTVYTITNQRLVIRFGVAVPMMINIPWASVAAADLRRCADGSGDIALTLVPEKRMSYLTLWPNVRPWHYGRVQPMIRGVSNPTAVASKLARVVTGETWQQPAAERAAPLSDRGMAAAS